MKCHHVTGQGLSGIADQAGIRLIVRLQFHLAGTIFHIGSDFHRAVERLVLGFGILHAIEPVGQVFFQVLNGNGISAGVLDGITVAVEDVDRLHGQVSQIDGPRGGDGQHDFLDMTFKQVHFPGIHDQTSKRPAPHGTAWIQTRGNRAGGLANSVGRIGGGQHSAHGAHHGRGHKGHSPVTKQQPLHQDFDFDHLRVAVDEAVAGRGRGDRRF